MGPRPPGGFRLVVLTRDCVFADAVLQRLSTAPHVSVAGLVKSTRPFRDADGPLATLRAFHRLTGLRYTLHLVATSVAVPGLSRWRPLAAWGRRLSVPVLATGDVNGEAARAFVEGCAPDVLLCVDFNQILRPPLIGRGRRAFNIHPSLLPAHRGHAPVFHGMLAGDATFGVTVHALADRVDRGAVLAARTVDVAGLGLAARQVALFAAGADAFAEALATDPDRLVPQSPGGNANTYPTPAEVRAFRAAGHRF